MFNYAAYKHLPSLDGLQRYLEMKVEPGHFLKAVLNNDLKEAVNRADMHNIRLLPDYITFLYNEAPSSSWGSPEKVHAWLYPEKERGV